MITRPQHSRTNTITTRRNKFTTKHNKRTLRKLNFSITSQQRNTHSTVTHRSNLCYKFVFYILYKQNTIIITSSLESTSRFIPSASPLQSCLDSSPSLVNPSSSSSPLCSHYSFTPGSKPTFPTNHSNFNRLLIAFVLPSRIMGLYWTGLIVLIGLLLVGFSFKFLTFVPCGRLSWLHISILLHVKNKVSYRIKDNRII